MPRAPFLHSAALVLGLFSTLPAIAQPQQLGPETPATSFKFDFGSERAAEGYIAVTPADVYSTRKGFGFEDSPELQAVAGEGADSLTNDAILGNKPFHFSVKVPEGSYRVKLTTGSPNDVSRTTVKSELRRLMVEGVATEKGKFVTSTFVVNVRTPRITADRDVRLKDRERTTEWRNWDDRLTFEFNDTRPAIASLEIERVTNLPTLFIIGDSTVCDQPRESFNSWGQMLTRFFKPDIVLANHGESGESYRSSLAAGRFEKVFSQMRPGDYLIMQFGHNDMKSVDEANYSESIRTVVARCKELKGIPIVVSPMERRNFEADGKIRESHRGFPAAAKATAQELGVAFIDLHAMSKVFYESLGPQKAKLAFANNGDDATHHNNYGSYQLAKCIAEGIREKVPELGAHLIDGLPKFDPARPDNVETFVMPASPNFTTETPYGS